jgi:hypothetical protein
MFWKKCNKKIYIKIFKQFIYQVVYGLKFNFVHLVDMNLLASKFKLTMNTLKYIYAYSKSRCYSIDIFLNNI